LSQLGLLLFPIALKMNELRSTSTGIASSTLPLTLILVRCNQLVRALYSHATTVHGDCKITVQFSHGFFPPLNRVITKTRKVRSRITRDACIFFPSWTRIAAHTASHLTNQTFLASLLLSVSYRYWGANARSCNSLNAMPTRSLMHGRCKIKRKPFKFVKLSSRRAGVHILLPWLPHPKYDPLIAVVRDCKTISLHGLVSERPSLLRKVLGIS
jgi:hypothetical protein